MFINESKIFTVLTIENNIFYIIALDEVGRGAGAGPVVVCASIWKTSEKPKRVKSKWLPLIADSKQLTQEKREECFSFICQDYNLSMEDFSHSFTKNHTNLDLMRSKLIKPNKIFKFSQKELRKIKSQKNKFFACLCFSLGVASNHEIDNINIWNAIQIAANRALFEIQDKMKKFGLINPFNNSIMLLDGHIPIKIFKDFVHIPQMTIINGDAFLKTIGFSSIIAKVIRDKYMINLKEEFPNIGFEHHKGYLTKNHKINLKKYGQTRFHRQSFLKNFDLAMT